MFRRSKQSEFDIADHPELLAALVALEQQAYERGRRDAVAIAAELLDEVRDDSEASDDYRAGIDDVIQRMES